MGWRTSIWLKAANPAERITGEKRYLSAMELKGKGQQSVKAARSCPKGLGDHSLSGWLEMPGCRGFLRFVCRGEAAIQVKQERFDHGGDYCSEGSVGDASDVRQNGHPAVASSTLVRLEMESSVFQ
jgi:hypothetical protein